ncbi:hypothetical protein JHK87_026952 [Glycine soja]|nr:hypothetical protein JHK87_026952 [Glycine soja]
MTELESFAGVNAVKGDRYGDEDGSAHGYPGIASCGGNRNWFLSSALGFGFLVVLIFLTYLLAAKLFGLQTAPKPSIELRTYVAGNYMAAIITMWYIHVLARFVTASTDNLLGILAIPKGQDTIIKHPMELLPTTSLQMQSMKQQKTMEMRKILLD